MVSLVELSQFVEIKFWNIVTPMMAEKGPLMKIIKTHQRILSSRAGYLMTLLIVWAAVGFLSGMVLGRIIWIVQMN
jgi:hypothetical protein